MKRARQAPVLFALGLVALAPFLALVFRLDVPVDVAATKGCVRTIWLVTPLVWFAQLALAGSVDAPSAIRGLANAVVPCGLALVAIAIGLVALVVPGLLLLVLFALTGAVGGDPQGALDASRDAVRGRFVRVALVVAGALVVDAAIVYLAQRLLLDVPAKPSPAQLATFVGFRRAVALGLAIATPVVAVALATTARAARR